MSEYILVEPVELRDDELDLVTGGNHSLVDIDINKTLNNNKVQIGVNVLGNQGQNQR